jgi:hypothetical protein
MSYFKNVFCTAVNQKFVSLTLYTGYQMVKLPPQAGMPETSFTFVSLIHCSNCVEYEQFSEELKVIFLMENPTLPLHGLVYIYDLATLTFSSSARDSSANQHLSSACSLATLLSPLSPRSIVRGRGGGLTGLNILGTRKGRDFWEIPGERVGGTTDITIQGVNNSYILHRRKVGLY